MEQIIHDDNFFQRVRIALFFVVFLLLVFQTPALLAAESLEEGAKREGKLLFYSTMPVPDNQVLLSAFQKKYPFIKAEFYRGSSSPLLVKALAEKRMGQTHADVVLSTPPNFINLFKKEGLLGKYISPESKFISLWLNDPEGFWTAIYTSYFTFTYHTKMIATKDLPKTYEDLFNPRWKGKIGISISDLEWYIGMLDFLGEAKGKQFMERLSEQDPVLRSTRSLIINLMIAGEFPLALTAVQNVLEQQKKGAPIDMIPFPTPNLAAFRTIGIFANAPHPNAAKLFVDFILSKEGQSLLNSINRNPLRMDVQVDPRLEKIMRNTFPIKPIDVELMQSYQKEWNKIFIKR